MLAVLAECGKAKAVSCGFLSVRNSFIVAAVSSIKIRLAGRLPLAKLRKAREAKKAKTGRCEGRKPYGFFEGEEKVVKRIK